jgi:hypothetical protein
MDAVAGGDLIDRQLAFDRFQGDLDNENGGARFSLPLHNAS